MDLTLIACLLTLTPDVVTDPPAGTEQNQVLGGLALLGIVVLWVLVAAVFLLVINRVLRRASPSGARMYAPQEDEFDASPADPWVESARRIGPTSGQTPDDHASQN